MKTIYQKLALVATGTALSLTALDVNPTQAAFKTVEGNSNRQIASIVGDESFSFKVRNLQQERKPELNSKKNSLIAQTDYKVKHYYYTGNTDSNGYFQIPHKLDVSRILGIETAVRHTNGKWYTVFKSNLYDNTFGFDSTYVFGQIAWSAFYNRPVRVVVKYQDTSKPSDDY
ncbi:hypothetical protein LC605_22055 [Nostoc sp. CHAB 5836]|uniref:hypothetical protein n=1 Tax=Nostoc sp. CHAB 5836 TaxID=2780404 RepID=UPI001E5D7E01|nr:hypothetical protein [Nostoc sp. CHAB 5836]MCC5617724.1 hypothetical protein [Nostoc sp. CHAB 5836]